MKALSLILLATAVGFSRDSADQLIEDIEAVLRAPSFAVKAQLYCESKIPGKGLAKQYADLLASQPKKQEEEVKRQQHLSYLQRMLSAYLHSLNQCVGSYENGSERFPSDAELRAREDEIRHAASKPAGPSAPGQQGKAATAAPAPKSISGRPTDGPPVLVYKVQPEYSQAARRAHWSGNIRAVIQIDEQGRVTDVQIVDSPGLDLEPNVIAAVKRWKFTPAIKNGVPVPARGEIMVSMRTF